MLAYGPYHEVDQLNIFEAKTLRFTMTLSRRQILLSSVILTSPLATATQASEVSTSAKGELSPGTNLEQIYNNLLKNGHGIQKKNLPENLPIVVVVTDTQCPWCSKFWQAALPLTDRINFIYYPVAVLRDDSVSQGGAVLSAPNPWMMMIRHERHFKDVDHRGLKTDTMIIPQKFRDMVWTNSKIFRRAGGIVVPLGIFKNAKGEYVPIFSGTNTDEMEKLLNLSNK